jgi:hypothetical protein
MQMEPRQKLDYLGSIINSKNKIKVLFELFPLKVTYCAASLASIH